MSQINKSRESEEIAYLPISQHQDREGLYQHLAKMCDVKIGLLKKDLERQERLKKHYELHAEAHKFYIAKLIVDRAD